MSMPTHIAIIMDGNGRWAKKQNRPRNYGHLKGARVARSTITACAERGLKYLTLYAFSTENWLRPQEEVFFLMKLLERNIRKERETLIKNNIQFRVIGNVEELPEGVRRETLRSIEVTRENTGMVLTFAVNYGSRKEITEAVKEIVLNVRSGKISSDDVSESLIAFHLNSSYLPDPDLVIRTSGEFRISNFLLWQSAYSEFYITEKNWPEFDSTELEKALGAYEKRERRYGKTSHQVQLEVTT
ncbi:MAG: isoprenyl transferase [Bdellovibrionales bacterium]